MFQVEVMQAKSNTKQQAVKARTSVKEKHPSKQ